MGAVPGNDLVAPAGQGSSEGTHLDGVVTIGHVDDEALDPLACGGLVAVCVVELPDGLLGTPGGGHFSTGVSGPQQADELTATRVFESFLGLGEQAPDPIERVGLATTVPRVSFWTRRRASSSLALACFTTWNGSATWAAPGTMASKTARWDPEGSRVAHSIPARRRPGHRATAPASGASTGDDIEELAGSDIRDRGGELLTAIAPPAAPRRARAH